MSVLVLNFTKLEYLASQLAPSILRIGGSEEDIAVYDVGSYIPVVPRKDGNSTCPGLFCLKMKRWKEIHDFCKKAGCKTAFGLNAMVGKGGLGPNRNPEKKWDSCNAEALLQYTKDNALDDTVYGWELGNELQHDLTAAEEAAEYKILRGIINKIWASTKPADRPKIIGPDMNPDPHWLAQFLPLAHPYVDKVTIHIYEGYGLNPKLAEEIPTEKFLDGAIAQGVPSAKDVSMFPRLQAWVGETAAAWHSGQMNTTNAFVSSFWYLDSLAGLAQQNYTMQCRQTLIGGYYGLLSHEYKPNPDYFTLVLWQKLMGTRVLSTSKPQNGVRVYAQCMKGTSGGVVLVMININTGAHGAATVNTPELGGQRVEFILTADSPRSRVMKLNGKLLQLDHEGKLPNMDGMKKPTTSPFVMPAFSLAYVAYPEANWAVCK
eukprot:TRINITY_DN66798_c9_g1_i1.p1 TRINITY_DN66798_c9_g1~~TRINITY_DN66798_c9_g1_i1.p1  ORF type:complete len:503 (-),score=50.25 TRINITY_DN66798_c9_g1_i1:891-2186(-)